MQKKSSNHSDLKASFAASPPKLRPRPQTFSQAASFLPLNLYLKFKTDHEMSSSIKAVRFIASDCLFVTMRLARISAVGRGGDVHCMQSPAAVPDMLRI
eukprot:2396210-Amphidinium_carterae.1